MTSSPNSANSGNRRVVITGMGVISPVGLDTETFWTSLVNGVSGIRAITRPELAYDKVSVAAIVEGFDPLRFLDRKEARRMDRYCQFALGAAKEAVAQAAGLMAAYAPERVGTVVGSGVGGLETIETEYTKLFQGGKGRVSPLFVPMMIDLGLLQDRCLKVTSVKHLVILKVLRGAVEHIHPIDRQTVV